MSDTPASSRWLILVLFAAGGAGVHALLWLAFDRLADGWLQKFGWPVNSLPTIAALGAIGGVIFGRAVLARLQLRQEAAEDPVEPSSETPSEPELDLSALPDLPAFADPVRLARRSAERVGGVTADVFDLTTEASDGDGGTVHVTRTFVLLPADGLPAFDLAPHQFTSQVFTWLGADGVRFDPAAAESSGGSKLVNQFEAAYKLTGVSVETMMTGRVDADDDAVRRVFTLSVLRAALARSDWRVQSRGGRMVFWVGPEPLGPKRRAKVATDAVALHAAFLAAHAGTRGDPILPAPPGTVSSERQAARVQAALLGGVLGAFVGFFVAGVLNAMEFFAQPIGQREAGNGWASARFLALTLGGAAAGAVVGRLLPLRRPLLRKPNDPRREKVVGCVGAVGLFGGFLAGGVAGAVLGEMLGLKFEDAPMRAALFFGGMGVGAIGGPIVLGVATNLVYRWFAGSRD